MDVRIERYPFIWGPFQLAAVGSRFRTVMLSLPVAWRQISIPFIGGYFSHLRGLIRRRVQYQLMRSHDLLLDVSVQAFDIVINNRTEEVFREEVQSYLRGHSDRIRSISIYQSPYSPFSSWSTLDNFRRVEVLQSVHLSDSVFRGWPG